VPIAGGTRVSIGIFSYLNTMTFGINADFDAFPDVDVLSGGIRAGIEELMDIGKKEPTSKESSAAASQ
jgi:diacylglycerol O-acyltransferase / wax synthase